MEVITRNMVSRLLPLRGRDSHKGSFGNVLLVAGSVGMAGAAVLCAGACLRGGAGLVRVAVPGELSHIIHIAVPEATCVERGSLHANNESGSEPNRFGAYNAVAAGPGLGASRETLELVVSLVNNFGGPFVLDADALNVIAGIPEMRLNNCIITPHPGEAGRLLGISTSEVQADREAAARALVLKYGSVTVLKGYETIVAALGGEANSISLYKNTTGNPGMATAGSGDVLTGLILALLGQGLSLSDAAIAGAYIHGLAGDMVYEDKGLHGLIASDIKEKIPYAIRNLWFDTHSFKW
jgi:NAD(P)H-hydrate epimerase